MIPIDTTVNLFSQSFFFVGGGHILIAAMGRQPVEGVLGLLPDDSCDKHQYTRDLREDNRLG